jgi:hypothetical protein
MLAVGSDALFSRGIHNYYVRDQTNTFVVPQLVEGVSVCLAGHRAVRNGSGREEKVRCEKGSFDRMNSPARGMHQTFHSTALLQDLAPGPTGARPRAHVAR